jgi:hypothetical protein
MLVHRESDSTVVNSENQASKQTIAQRRHLRPYILLFILCLFLGIVFFTYTLTSPEIEDSIGYIYAGEQLALGQGPTYLDPNSAIAGPYFSMYAFQIGRDDDARMYLGFPPGYPLLLALGIVVTRSPESAHYVVPVLALAGLFVTFAFGKLLSSREWVGIWAAVFLGFTPAYWDFGTSAWSEIPATFFLVSGLCLYLISHQSTRSQRRIIIVSLLAGLLIGYSFFIRYANMVILPAILIHEFVNKRIKIFHERARWPFYVALISSVIAIFVFNNHYYGGPLLTSYSPEHGWYPNAPFSLQYALGQSFVGGRSMIEVGQTLWANFPIIILLAPVGWFLPPRPSGALAASATLGFLALYSVYAFAPTGINSRFLIPTYPFIAVSIAQSIYSIGQRIPRKEVRRLAGGLLFIALCFPLIRQIQDLESRNTNSLESTQFAVELANRTEPDAVLLTYVHNDRIAYYGDRSVLNYRRIPVSDPDRKQYRIEMLEPCLVQSIDMLLQRDVPVYYVDDRSPPLWDSLDILHKHYEMEIVGESPATYRVGVHKMKPVGIDSSLQETCEQYQ